MFNYFYNMCSFDLRDESAMLVAPEDRPKVPFPYFSEVMTGIEYTADIRMLQEGQLKNGLKCISDIRERYDGSKRSLFNEIECGHHYYRTIAWWAREFNLKGFQYSVIDKTINLEIRWVNSFGIMAMYGVIAKFQRI